MPLEHSKVHLSMANRLSGRNTVIKTVTGIYNAYHPAKVRTSHKKWQQTVCWSISTQVHHVLVVSQVHNVPMTMSGH